jgi:hypothetical protein
MGWHPPKRYEFEGPAPKLGAGSSRPLPNERTRLFRVNVKQPGSPLLRVTIPAASRGKAIMYCKNRWPGCTAEVAE